MSKRKTTPSPLNAGDYIQAEVAMRQIRGGDGNLFPESFRWSLNAQAVCSNTIEHTLSDWYDYSFEERISLIVQDLKLFTALDYTNRNAAILFDVRRRLALYMEHLRVIELSAVEEKYAAQRRRLDQMRDSYKPASPRWSAIPGLLR